MRRTEHRRAATGGFAILTVLLVLMALFVLVAPFLLTARNADNASSELADRAGARLALDSAARHARALLRESHPARDATPYYDSAEELDVRAEFPEDVLRPDDPKGVMWDLEVCDLSGRIDLDTAPPQLIANLTGLVARTSRPVAAEDEELPVSGAGAFPDQGFLWVEGERIGYAAREDRLLTGAQRGLLAQTNADGDPLGCGPAHARTIAAGRPVFEQRAWALAEWRVAHAIRDAATGHWTPARLDGFDQLVDVEAFSMAGELGPEVVAALRAHGTVWGDERAGPRWQNATRVRNSLERGVDCGLLVDDARWFNPGTTVQILSAGISELALVQKSSSGRVTLTEPVQNDYTAYEAEVRPLARRPVNVNTATEDVLAALFENLKLRNVNERVTSSEASQLAAVIAESRPFEGFRDFLERVVYPAGGIEGLPDDAPVVPEVFAGDAPGFLDEEDAAAVYLNALNANDRLLEFSTMPLAFTSRDVYAMELRSSVNAKSGVERLGLARDDVELVVPQEPLMGLWTRQEDFDLALRLERSAPYWSTGPEATSQYAADYSTPASRYAAHMGVEDPETGGRLNTFASREDDGWAKLETARVDETPARVRGRVMHFDRERTDPEGRDVSQAPVALDPFGPRVAWSERDGLLEPLSFSAWVKPLRGLNNDELLLDVGSNLPAPLESDRVMLVADDGDLVLRVLDAVGDAPDTEFREVGEVRYPMDGADTPGLPTDTWSHVAIDVRGNRPSQMTMIVDGRVAPETPGLTRLTGTLGDADTTIAVESTEGFPDECVLRIGDEIIEAVVTSDTTFDATWDPLTARGGRLARERVKYTTPDDAAYVPEALGERAKLTQHPTGSSVELYGYSVPLAGVVTDASDPLPFGLGPLRVARVSGASASSGAEAEAIRVPGWQTPLPVTIGTGTRTDALEALTISPADQNVEGSLQEKTRWLAENVMPAFDPNGGFAVLVQRPFNVNGSYRTIEGESVGGIEIIEYSGWRNIGEGILVNVAARGLTPPLGATGASGQIFPDVSVDNSDSKANPDADPPIGDRVAFVLDWADGIQTVDGQSLLDTFQNRRENQAFLIPISIPGGRSWLDVQFPSTHSELAQIAGDDPATTEWVRYDEVAPGMGHLVRSDPRYLRVARAACLGRIYEPGDLVPDLSWTFQAIDIPDDPTDPDDPSGPGGPGGGAIGDQPGGPPPLPAGQGVTGSYWTPFVGEDEHGEDFPISKAVESALQFRGVFGTHSHAHAAGTEVTPVFRLYTSSDPDDQTPEFGEPTEDYGWPGRLDDAFLVSDLEGATILGEPVKLWHAHRPFQYLQYEWDDPSENGELVLGTDNHIVEQASELTRYTWFSLEGAAPVPLMTETVEPPGDQRLRSRLVKFPSGELPRTVERASLGGRFDSPGTDAPAALVDEVVFGDSRLGAAARPEVLGTAMILADALGEDAGGVIVLESGVSRGATRLAFPGMLDGLPTGGGLVRIGEEILAYQTVDPAIGIVLPETGGRGMLGTTPQNHQPGESVTWLEGWTVSTLAGDVSEESGALPLFSLDGFPPTGTVRVDDELVHYTRLHGGSLGMPQASDVAGARDGDGPGLFRGRYGTEPAAHASGTPVILHPFRYWDRWAERADAPELGYFGFSLAQPGAFWSSVFWEEEEGLHAGPRLAVLQRTDPAVPWDADPTEADGLALYFEGMQGDEGNPVDRQSDRVEWRVFARYEPGSFDPLQGLFHGWKASPVLRYFGTEYLAPGMKLRSVER